MKYILQLLWFICPQVNVFAQHSSNEISNLSSNPKFYYSELIILTKCGQKVIVVLDDSFVQDNSALENASLQVYRIAKAIGKICEVRQNREWFGQKKIDHILLTNRKIHQELEITWLNRELHFYSFYGGDVQPSISQLEQTLIQLIASKGPELKNKQESDHRK